MGNEFKVEIMNSNLRFLSEILDSEWYGTYKFKFKN